MARVCSVLISLALVVSTASGKQVIEDLSHVQKPGLLAYPLYPDLNFTISHRGISAGLGGLWLEYNNFATVEHYGTHVDVPSHLMKGQWRLHEVPVENFMGPAVVIDLIERAKQDPDTEVTVADLQAWEEKHGRIPDMAMVLLRSDWDKKFSDAKAFFGSETPHDTKSYHFPGFHPDSVKWLVENRPNFNGIGSDAISFDNGPSSTFGAHTHLFRANKVGYENLANLDKLPEAGAMFYAAPMNLHDGSGCPVRAFAIYDPDSSASARAAPMLFVLLSLLLTYAIIVGK